MDLIQQIMMFLGPIAEQYLGKLPASILQVLVLIGTLRLVVKPLMTALHAFVLETPSKKDDEFFALVEQSKLYKFLIYLMDWLASIKLPK